MPEFDITIVNLKFFQKRGADLRRSGYESRLLKAGDGRSQN
jgi:hypothetical protein